MPPTASIETVRRIMLSFAEATGLLDQEQPPRRYLWTDAFAVCNFVELYRQTRDESWLSLALRLVDQVHHVLGRHRPGSHLSGWISGLPEEEGERHPTRGGLRIGKPLDERHPDEPPDERQEWDRDGQYYHYLTKWMHALHCVSRVTSDARYLVWAVELARTAHESFSYAPPWGGAKRLYWKMSIDLTRPQVASMGQHDPLDGVATLSELHSAAKGFGAASFPDLQRGIADLSSICRGQDLTTDDSLGIGGLLCDACTMAQLMNKGDFADSALLKSVVDAALVGLKAFAGNGMLHFPTRYRLAFRELGLSIGLRGVLRLPDLPGGPERPRLEALREYLQLARRIEEFWLDEKNYESRNWKEHSDINMVMLATSLAPGEFLSAV